MSYKQYKLEWLQHDISKDLIKVIKDDIELLKDQWAKGAFTGETQDATAQKNAKAIGQVETLEVLLELITSVEDEQQ